MVFLLPGEAYTVFRCMCPCLGVVEEDRAGGKVSAAKRHWEPPPSVSPQCFYPGASSYSCILAVSGINTVAKGTWVLQSPCGRAARNYGRALCARLLLNVCA